MRKKLIVGVVGAAVILAGLGVGGYAVKKSVDAKAACAALTSQAGGSFDPVRIAGDGRRAVILGDSYAGGYFLQDASDSWASTLAGTEGWNTTIAGVGSTGFVNDSSCGGDSFTARSSVLDGADVVIIQGGLNDFRQNPDDVQAAARQLIESAPSSAEVFLVGPTNAPARPEAAVIDAALSEAVANTEARYISTQDWNLEYMPDGVHLTEAGHGMFAASVQDEL